MDARKATDRGLGIYQQHMRVLIRRTLRAEFGENWWREKVAPLLLPPAQSRALRALDDGLNPQVLVNIEEFGRVIDAYSDLFPKAIRTDEHRKRFREIANGRNERVSSDSSWSGADAEWLLAACRDMLERCSLLVGAQEIENIANELRSPSVGNQPATRRSGEDRMVVADPKEALDEGLDIFRSDMRVLIRKTLQAEFGEIWCREKVAPLFPPGKRKLIIKNLEAGEPADEQVDVNDFSTVIKEFGELFPEAIRQGEHHNRFDDITRARNAWGHRLGRLGKSPHRREAEAVLGACIDVLRQRELIDSALAIEDIVRQLSGSPRDPGNG